MKHKYKMQFCTRCGCPLSAGSLFCKNCGATIETPDPNQPFMNNSTTNNIRKSINKRNKMQAKVSGTKIGMIICFAFAAFFIPMAIATDLSMLALSFFLGILGAMFLILDRTPKESQYILGKSKGLKKGMFIFLSLFLAFVLFMAIINAFPESPTDTNDNDTKQSQQTEKINNNNNNNKTPASNENGSANNSPPVEKSKSPVTISGWSWTRNSVGGVEWNFKFTNNSDKTIKYITMSWDCYNAVGDKVYDEITGKSSYSTQYTGPLEPGQTTDTMCTTSLFYSYSYKTSKLTKLQVEFMDGTKVQVTDDLYTDIIIAD